MAGAYHLYDELRAECPVARVRFAGAAGDEPLTADEKAQIARAPLSAPGLEGWLLTRYADATATMLDDDDFSVNAQTALTAEQRANIPADAAYTPLTRSILTLDAPDHTRLRKLVQPWFTGKAIGALRPRIEEIAHELLDAAEEASAARGESAPERTMELIEAFAYPLPVTVISEMLGVPREDRAAVQAWSEALIARRGKTLSDEQRESIRDFSDYLRRLADRKRAEPGEDLITFLVNAEEEGDRLDDDELLAMIFLIYVAGHVTTVNLIGNGVVALLSHPAQLARVKNDLTHVNNLVEETLRYWGPVEQTVPRVARDEVSIAGVAISPRERVIVSLAAADRDPARFANPDQFDIGRTDANRHIAFGKGIHACLGSPLARAEGEIAFVTLLRRLPELRLAVPVSELAWRPNFLRGFKEIPVRF